MAESTETARTETVNSYFIPGYGISRAVIQSEIQFHCGPESIARPFTLQGRDGYLVTTRGPPLTKEQIQDLKESSIQYEERQAKRAGKGTDVYVNRPVSVSQRCYRGC